MGSNFSPDDLSIIRRAAQLLGLPAEDVRLERSQHDPYASFPESLYQICAFMVHSEAMKFPAWSMVAQSRYGYAAALEELARSRHVVTRKAVGA